MFTDIRKIILRTIGIVVFILIAIFSYYQYRSYVNGPEIVKINIKDYTETRDPSITLDAEIINTKKININNRSVAIKNDNNIKEIVVFSPGNNIIKIGLEDIFGKKRSYIYNIYYSTVLTDYSTLQEVKHRKSEEETEAEELIINN